MRIFKNEMTRTLATGAIVLLSLGLTGCGASVSEPAPQITGSSSVATPAVDLFTNAGGAEVLKEYPEETYQTREAVQAAWATYKDFAELEAFRHARDASKDKQLVTDFVRGIDSKGGFSQELVDGIKRGVDSDVGRVRAVLTVPGNGVVDFQKKNYPLDEDADATKNGERAFPSKFPKPTVTLSADKKLVHIDGIREYTYPLQGGLQFSGTSNYGVDVELKPGGHWTITETHIQGLTVDVSPRPVPKPSKEAIS